jgi:hypothetical protein
MKKLISTLIILIACWQGWALAQSTSNTAADTSYGVAARSEIYPIPSITISDAQFLQGDSNGKAVQVGGILRYPANPTKLSSKLPVVVIVHGSSGMGPMVTTGPIHSLREDMPLLPSIVLQGEA